MTPDQRVARVERILRPALAVLLDPDSDPAAVSDARETLSRVTGLLDAIHPPEGGSGSVNPGRPPPHDARPRARDAPADDPGNDERAAAGLRRLRQGRDTCTATRRDGSHCQAPAIPGGLVCRRHGGSAPQVRIKARHFQLQAALYEASLDFGEAKGTPGEFDALCAWSRAKNDLDAYEARLGKLASLRAEVRRQRAEAAAGQAPVQQ